MLPFLIHLCCCSHLCGTARRTRTCLTGFAPNTWTLVPVHQMGVVLWEIFDCDTNTTRHVALLYLPIMVLPERKVMVLHKFWPQVLLEVLKKGCKRRAINIGCRGLGLEVPTEHFGFVPIFTCNPGLQGVYLVVRFPLDLGKVMVTDAGAQHT